MDDYTSIIMLESVKKPKLKFMLLALIWKYILNYQDNATQFLLFNMFQLISLPSWIKINEWSCLVIHAMEIVKKHSISHNIIHGIITPLDWPISGLCLIYFGNFLGELFIWFYMWRTPEYDESVRNVYIQM